MTAEELVKLAAELAAAYEPLVRVTEDFGPCQHTGCASPQRVVGRDERDGRVYLSSSCPWHAFPELLEAFLARAGE